MDPGSESRVRLPALSRLFSRFLIFCRRLLSLQFYGDLFTAMPTHRLVNLSLANHGPQAPLYLYHFLEDGDYNWGKVSFGISGKGVTHTDELGYLMRITSPSSFPAQTILDHHSPSSRTLCSLTKLWTNFAK